MIDIERINCQLSHGKIFNLNFLHVGIKTVYIHHNAQFSLKKLYTNLSFPVDS